MRVALSVRSLFLGVALAVGVVATWNVLVSARSIIATSVAAIVMTVVLTGPVDWLERHMRRGIAIAVTLLTVTGLLGLMTWALVDDLDAAFSRLDDSSRRAAAKLEESERVGEVARDLRLVERVEAAVENLRESTQDRARRTAFRAATYLIAGVLTIFLLIYLRRMIDGGLRQIRDPHRRDRAERVITAALSHGRRYLLAALGQAVVVGGASYGAFRLVGLPAGVALAVVVGLASVVPYFGILIGFVPALLFSGAFEPGIATGSLVAVALVLQFGSIAMTWELSRRALYVGPAVTLIAVLLGFAVYGPAGAIFGTALTVFGVAVLEAAGQEMGTEPQA